MKKLFLNNGLSIVFFLLFALTLVGQVFFGIQEHNKEIIEAGGTAVSMTE